jgi:flagellar motility protein MotE (MotC chaperone)
MSAIVSLPGEDRRLALKGAISTSIVVALGVQGWQLAATDWTTVAGSLDALIASPVVAAGTALPPADAGAALPPATSLPSAPVPFTPPPSFATNPIAAELEEEMSRLVNELRTGARPMAPTTSLMAPADLGRAAVSSRLAAMVDRLEALNAEEKARAAGASAEVAKSKAFFENMKPAEAAAIFVSMEDGVAAEIFAAMDERKAAAVLAAMPSDRAARITLAIREMPPPPNAKPAKRR